ncbi:MAG TPA: hypothetical protein VG842_08730 [Sediminibacterium sp.]|nr:hypothetical protein [Sediminibacterium sp.]
MEADVTAQASYTPEALTVAINPQTGSYSVVSKRFNWHFTGSIGHPMDSAKFLSGKDAVGDYWMIRFRWVDKIAYRASIRWYKRKPIVLFTLNMPNGSKGYSPVPFPDFTKLPTGLYPFSYHNRIFPLAQITAENTATPWMFFNEKLQAFVVSPASDFMVSMMSGNGTGRIASGLNPEVQQLPEGFTHSSIFVMGRNIHTAWNRWGEALRNIYQRKRPAADADPMLRYFGFWTDNGGDYYYHYDTTLGYAGTLLAVRDHYKKEGIPLGYMQLDSWWYQKTRNNVYGIQGADKKIKEYPVGRWNLSGGLWKYEADPQLFPQGLKAFRQQLGLPLITHNRWIDSASPYHQQYKISGISAIDSGYWNEVMAYLHDAGVAGYEQDWMNYAYTNNPEMISDIRIGNAFTDEMAKAAGKYGISLQYCMGLPRYFMQGLKYNNLTTIRTAGDRFKPERWFNFIFTSQLAYEMGIWPWSDVFRSGEKGNMIVSVLSAGPVGTGDSIGHENKDNIFLASRKDGVLVKPDLPLLPMDRDYLHFAQKKKLPVLAHTYTQHGDIRTSYVFAFMEDSTLEHQYSFTPAELDYSGRVAIFNPFTAHLRIQKADLLYRGQIPEDRYQLLEIAPVDSVSGIAFFGDAGKIAATGKKRLPHLKWIPGGIQLEAIFEEGEGELVFRGYAPHAVKASRGKLVWDAKTGLFTLTVKAARNRKVSKNITILTKS